MLIAVSCLSPVNTQILIPAYAKHELKSKLKCANPYHAKQLNCFGDSIL